MEEVKSVGKVRVYEIAKEVGVANKVLVAKIQSLGIDIKNHMSSLDLDDVSRVKRALEKERQENLVEERISATVIRRRQAVDGRGDRADRFLHGEIRLFPAHAGSDPAGIAGHGDDAAGLQLADDELVAAARGVDVEAAGGDDLRAEVLQFTPEIRAGLGSAVREGNSSHAVAGVMQDLLKRKRSLRVRTGVTVHDRDAAWGIWFRGGAGSDEEHDRQP